MKQLSGLDASFLYMETAQMPMHVGALHVFELPAGWRGKFVSALRQHIQQRLALAPPLHRRLWWMPLNMANPAWVDAEPDLKLHIVEVRLPKGAGMAELHAQVGALHPVLLERSRPLWKFHVFEGLAPAANGHKRVAMYSQLHHAAVDGQAAVALANAILDLGPEPRAGAAAQGKRVQVLRLEMSEMLGGVLGKQAQQVAGIIRGLPATVSALGGVASKLITGSALLGGNKAGGKAGGKLTLAPRTPLNVSVSAGRAFATATLPLPALKLLARAHGTTLNDLVLMLCSSALRRYYGKRHQLPRKSMIAAVPISLRQKGDASADNQASMSLVSLGTNIADPARRLAHVLAATAAMKSTMGGLKHVLPTDFPSLGMPWLIEAAAALYGKARVAERIPQVANLAISNVPGPPVPLYLAGAKMLTNYPASIIVHGMALNITVQSYDQSLDFGLMADAAAMPDVQELADALLIAFDDLQALPLPGEPEHPDSVPAEGAVKRARRALSASVTGALGKAAKAAAGAALDGAVAQVTGRMTGRMTGGAGRAGGTRSRASAPGKARPRR